MEEEKQYHWDAFISYSHNDSKWAEWMQEKLESFNPEAIGEQKNLKAFRDQTDLGLGFLKEQIDYELSRSRYLILLCSPHSAASYYVNDEVSTYIKLGRLEQIIPFIIDGEPHSSNPELECFPKALQQIEGDLLGANINEISPDYAVIKVIARMFHRKPDELWKRHLRAEEEEHQRLLEERNRLLSVQSRYLSEKANGLRATGNSYLARLVALYALPRHLDKPDRPYTREADQALRRAVSENSAFFYGHNALTTTCAFSPDDNILASADAEGDILLWDASNGRLLQTLNGSHSSVKSLDFTSDGNTLITLSADDIIRFWDIPAGQLNNTISIDKTKHKRIRAIATNPQLNALAIATKKHGITLYDTVTASEINHLAILDKNKMPLSVDALGYSADGNMLFAYCDDRTIRIFHTHFYQCIRSFSPAIRYITKISVNHDGSLIALMCDTSVSILSGTDYHEIQRLHGHSSKLQTVAFSTDGTLLLTSAANETKIWNTRTWAELDTLWSSLYYNGNTQAFFSHNRKRIAITLNKAIRICDTPLKQRDSLQNFDIKLPYGHIGGISCLALSSDARYLVSLGNSPNGVVWSIENGDLSQLYTINRSAASSRYACFSHDNKTLAVSEKKGMVHLLDPQTGREKSSLFFLARSIPLMVFSHNDKILATVHTSDWFISITHLDQHSTPLQVNLHHDRVLALSFSHDDRFIASIDKQHFFVWDTLTGRPVFSDTTRLRNYTDVAFSPDGNRLLVLYDNNSADLYDTDSNGKPTLVSQQQNVGTQAIICPSNQYILSVTAANKVNLWDFIGARYKECPLRLFSKNKIINERYLISFDTLDGRLRLYDLTAMQLICSATIYRPDYSLTIPSPSTGLVAIADDKSDILLYNTDTEENEWQLPDSNNHNKALAFSPDGRRLAFSDQRCKITLFDIHRRQRQGTLIVHTDTILGLSFSPDGALLASYSADHTVTIIDTLQVKIIKTFPFEETDIKLLAFENNNHTLLVITSQQVLRFDWNTGQRLLSRELMQNTSPHTIALSPDRQLLATAVGNNLSSILISRTLTGENIILLHGHKKTITHLHFSPDSSHLLSTSEDHTIRIWNLQSSRFPTILNSPEEEINQAYFTHDSRQIVTVSSVGRIRMWDASRLQDIIDATYQRFADRPLTELERQRYYLD